MINYDIALLLAIKNTPTLLWSVSVKRNIKGGTKRKTYGLTKEKATRISMNTRKSYLEQYIDKKVGEL